MIDETKHWIRLDDDEDPILYNCYMKWVHSHRLDQSWCKLFKTESYKRMQFHKEQTKRHFYWLLRRRIGKDRTFKVIKTKFHNELYVLVWETTDD